jgi:hypothetical protein
MPGKVQDQNAIGVTVQHTDVSLSCIYLTDDNSGATHSIEWPLQGAVDSVHGRLPG